MFLRCFFLFCFLFFTTNCFSNQIAVIGSGYVGLITASIFASFGYEVVCVDIDPKKNKLLQNGIVPIFEPGLSQLLFYPDPSRSIQYTDDIKRASRCLIFFICVGTPSDSFGKCDLSYVNAAIDQIVKLRAGPEIICIKSTVPPGTLRSIQQRLLDQKRDDIQLVYNPEFMRQGSALDDIFTTNPLVIGGDSTMAIKRIEALYKPLWDHNSKIEVIKTTFETAELIKYAWNGFSALRITYINELSRLCRDFSGDIFTLIKGVSLSEKLLPTKEIRPGPGYGGSCLPKDTKALARVLEEHAIYSSLVHQTIISNEQHISDLLGSIISSLGDSPSGKVVAVLGMSFKANTDDIRESSSIRIIEQLIKRGVIIRAYDPLTIQRMKSIFPNILYFDSIYEAAENSDCIVALTDSVEMNNIDLSRIARLVHHKIIIDPRNIFDPKEALDKDFILVNFGRI